MIEILALNLIFFIIFNRFNISSIIKILVNFFTNILFFVINYNNFLGLIEFFVFYLSILFIVLNIYTIRYSSLRFLILKKIHLKEKIPSENWLYQDRTNRIKSKRTFMRFELFYILNFIVNTLKKTTF
tara:strand:+ start:1560 stop:1943 length:384 start_codon:yes stop_codon:yes gene_type:complete